MTAFSVYISGLKQSIKSWKIGGSLYLLNLIFALVIVLPISTYLQSTIGNSLLTEALAERFNYTVMHDFLANYQLSISSITELSYIVILLYFVFSIFTAGGIVNTFFIADKAKELQNFWSGCTYFFWKMLRITLYFLLIHGLVLALFLFVFWTYTNGLSPDKLDSEMPIVNALKVLSPVYVFCAVLVSMWQNYVKIKAVELDDKWLFSAFKAGTSFVRQNFWKVCLVYFLNLLTLFVFYAFYRFGAVFSSLTASLIFGQIWIIGRIGLGLWNVGSGIVFCREE